jgi:hypothetical protein
MCPKLPRTTAIAESLDRSSTIPYSHTITLLRAKIFSAVRRLKLLKLRGSPTASRNPIKSKLTKHRTITSLRGPLVPQSIDISKAISRPQFLHARKENACIHEPACMSFKLSTFSSPKLQAASPAGYGSL